jgi:CRP-like cAMP-binding protein
MFTLQQALKEHQFTRGFFGPDSAKLAALAHEETFASDQVILRAGEQSRNFYLLLSGSVCVEVSAPYHTVSVQVLGPGEAFGWSSLLHHHDTLFQIRARESTSVIRLDGSSLSLLCEENPGFGLAFFRRILELVAGRVKATESRLGEFCGIAMSASGAAPGQASGS